MSDNNGGEPEPEAVNFAWHVHDSIGDWTAKVDIKASIVLALEGALLGFVITLSDQSGPLAHLSQAALNLDRAGLVCLSLSVLLAAAVVFPQLSRWNSRTSWQKGFVYFGHLKRWEADALRTHLAKLDDGAQLSALSKQLVVTSKVAWRKHSLLQASMVFLMASAVLLLLCDLYK